MPGWFRRAARASITRRDDASPPIHSPAKRAAFRAAARGVSWRDEEGMSYEAERLAIVRAFAVRREALRKVVSRAEWPAVLLALKFEKAMALAALRERRAARAYADRQERRRLRDSAPQP